MMGYRRRLPDAGLLAEKGEEHLYKVASVTSRSAGQPSTSGALTPAASCAPIAASWDEATPCMHGQASGLTGRAVFGMCWPGRQQQGWVGALGLHVYADQWPDGVLRTGVLAGSGEVECGCCFCAVPRAQCTAMECGHTFCDDCWRQHFQVQIGDGSARKLPCMGVRCGAVCDEDKVRPFWNPLNVSRAVSACMQGSGVRFAGGSGGAVLVPSRGGHPASVVSLSCTAPCYLGGMLQMEVGFLKLSSRVHAVLR